MNNIDLSLVKKGIKQLVLFSGLIGFLSLFLLSNISHTTAFKAILWFFLFIICLVPATQRIYRMGQELANRSWFNKLVGLSVIILGSILLIVGLAYVIALLTDSEELVTIASILLLFVPYFAAILVTGAMAVKSGDLEYVTLDTQSPYSNFLQTYDYYRIKTLGRYYFFDDYFFSYVWWLDNLRRLYRRRGLAKSPLLKLYALFPSLIFIYFTDEIKQYCRENKLSHLIPDNYFWRNLRLVNYVFTSLQLILPIIIVFLFKYPTIFEQHVKSAITIITLLICIYVSIMHELVEVTRNINRFTYNKSRPNKNEYSGFIHLGQID